MLPNCHFILECCVMFSGVKYKIVQCIYAGTNFIHDHALPAHSRGFAPKICPTLGLLHPRFFPGAGHFWGSSRGAGICLQTIFANFWNFHDNGKNWRLTALWGLFVALKVYTFLKQIIQTWIEPKLKKLK